METRPLIGVIVGGTSIVLSSLCFIVMPVFTPAIVLAVLAGAIGGAVALAGRARRIAVVTFTFALTPLFGFLLLEYDPVHFDTGYLAFGAFGVALVVGILALINYSRHKRASPDNV